MSMHRRIENLEKVLLTDDGNIPEAVIISVVDCRSDAGPETPITTLSSGGLVYSRADGEPFPDFKARSIEDARKHLPPMGIPCFLADGSLEI